jgi:Zn-dependent M28 family amino/carboxypeptidase
MATPRVLPKLVGARIKRGGCGWLVQGIGQVFDNLEMRFKKFVAIIPVLFTVAVLTAADSRRPSDAAADRVRAHIEFLASDLLQGREPGTPGFEIGAEYVAAQFRQLGLTPAGDAGTYFQRVPLVAYRLTDRGTFVLRGAGNRSVPLAFGEEYLPGKSPVAGPRSVSGELVFAGFGMVAPEHHRDDYGGLDVKGKIVVLIFGAPLDMPSEERAYYVSSRVKRAEAARRGAIGIVYVNTPEEDQREKFSDGARTWDSWGMTWRGTNGEPFDAVPSVPVLASLSSIAGQKLFEGTPKTFREVATMAESKQPPLEMPRFPLPWAADAKVTVETKPIESRNIAGLIPGRDPAVKDDVVVLSAHLDHIGVTAPVNGDSINNGALDNAAGVATTIEVARMMVNAPRAPRRSVLVLAVTAEEKGLVGSEYFARNPTVPRDRIVADVDLDMPILKYDFTDVVAFGSEHSSVGDAVRRAAGRMNLKLSPDPMPEEGLFTRSDHYRFVEIGVPAVFLMTGFANGGEKQFKEFLETCYHRPCDDTSQKLDYRVGAKFAQINYEIARELADAAARPAWKPGDFFGGKFGHR